MLAEGGSGSRRGRRQVREAIGDAGVEDGAEYIGGSEIISPTGKVLAKAQTEGDELVITTIDLAEIASLKNKWDLLADRRPEIYHQLVR